MTAAVKLADIERRLAIFAAGITGRHHDIEPYPSVTDDEDAETGRSPKPDAVFVPSEFAAFADKQQNLGAYRVMTLHQLGYREFGTYAFRIDEARERSAALAIHSAPQTSARDSDFVACFGHFALPALARTVFEMLEAHRVDCRMLRAYPGIAPHHARLAARELETRAAPPLDDVVGLLEALSRWTFGVERARLVADDATGLFAAIADAAGRVRDVDADVYASCDAMARILTTLETAGLVPASITALGEADLELLDIELPERPEFHGNSPDDWLQREARLADWLDDLDVMDVTIEEAERGDAAGRGTARASEQGLRALIDARDTLARRIGMEEAAVAAALDPEHGDGRRRYWYDEWDDPHRRYLTRYCRLYEERLGDAPAADAASLMQRIAEHRRDVRARFADLPLEALRRERRLVDGDDLDQDALVRYVVDRARGDVPDDRVYERRERTARDVAAAFLVDLSASTDDPTEKPPPPTPPAEPPHGVVNLRDPYDDEPYLWARGKGTLAPEAPPRRIVDVLKESMLLMAAGLRDYGDAFGIYGFSGYGRLCVEYYVAKEFRDAWTPVTLRALAAMKPRRSTRMGTAIRHTARKLTATGAALRVMIVLSDGFPQDCDYGPDRGDHAYGVADTAQALKEAEARGIATFCITVDKSGHDYLKAMCPEERYLIIEDIEALPDALAKVYRRLTNA